MTDQPTDNTLYLRKWAADIRTHNGRSVDADRLESIAAEIDRLRSVIEEIADMEGLDLGEPEMERAAIIDRCKAEMARWEKEDA